MVLLEHDFRSHVAWSAAALALILWRPLPSYAEVGQSQISVSIKYQIFRFDVPVNDALLMNGL